ncbi:hypothetical protein SteCoe_980 [Stentor coeruleus]|uniref:Uncharacterized protein n=1 Tax=Stentor coeruleus TaxID=5963 RepID=A0A1R2D2S2_9CILI|nr:hypothetical protein SteCoe_980 [Stentor coeruleus]
MEYKIGKIQVSIILSIVLGFQLLSIIINIISLCASTWIFPDSLLLTYNYKPMDELYDKCKDDLDNYYYSDYYYYDQEGEIYDWLKEHCDILKKSRKVSITYIVLVAISMALMASWMSLIVIALKNKFHLTLGLILGVISVLLQIAAIIQYSSINKITYDSLYDEDGYITTLEYFGEAGDGPKLSIVVCIIDSLLVFFMIYIQCKIRKLRS